MNTSQSLSPALNLAERARVASRESMLQEIDELRHDVDRVLLINEALWRMVRERLACTDAELVQRIQDIDLEDGYLDGRKAPSPPRTCPHCQQIAGKHRSLCIACGKPIEFLPFER